MSLQRSLSCVMILAGILACVSGLETAVGAQGPCTPDPGVGPAICIPAHQVPPQQEPWHNDTPAGCINYYYIWCWPDPEIGCWSEGYGMAMPSECMYNLDESAVGTCYNNYQEELVTLQYHRSECEFFEARCECVWIVGEEPDHLAPMCSCTIIL